MITIDNAALELAMGGLFAAFGSARNAEGNKLDLLVYEDQVRRAAKGALYMLTNDVLGEQANLTFEKST